MTEENFMLVSLEDSKSKVVAEVIGSKTCKKIINYLSENRGASQKDLSDSLKIPMNTLDYNIKKLLETGFIRKRKDFFWSKKGRKIVMYELSNKSVIISPKKSNFDKLKSIIPGVILIASVTFAVYVYEKIKFSNYSSIDIGGSAEMLLEKSSEYSEPAQDLISHSSNLFSSSPLWIWFLAGGILAILFFSILNWRKL